MIDFIFNGTISVDTTNKDVFIEEFNKFLNSQNANFRGSIKFNEFEDAEIIDD